MKIGTGRMYRWVVGIGAAAILFQAESCTLANPDTLQAFGDQFVIPQVASVFSDVVFFVLDNALVHLTT